MLCKKLSKTNGTMAAILGLENKIVEDVCNEIDENVKPANYNCPGQLVISGEYNAVEKACQILKERGAKRALILPVSGAFHSILWNQLRKSSKMELIRLNLENRSVKYIKTLVRSQ